MQQSKIVLNSLRIPYSPYEDILDHTTEAAENEPCSRLEPSPPTTPLKEVCCDTLVLRKIFAHPNPKQLTILDKDVVDEMIFRTENPRNRLILELMARSGMRIGEVLGLRAEDIEDRRVSLTNPKSGKESELVFLPQKVAERLKGYIIKPEIRPDERIFPITYSAARVIVRKAGMLVEVKVSPHDLRRHAATYASRAGTPIEIVSKLILRHSNLSTTQRYLGRISDVEALRWIDNLHG